MPKLYYYPSKGWITADVYETLEAQEQGWVSWVLPLLEFLNTGGRL